MTVFGIAGCTALLLTAFGLRDSIHDIVDKQFGDIYKYDLTVYVSSGTDVGTDRELSDFLASGYTRGYLAMHTESGKIGKEGLAIQVTDDPGLLPAILLRCANAKAERALISPRIQTA